METDMGKITADHVNTLDLCKRLKLICLIFLKCYSGVVMSSQNTAAEAPLQLAQVRDKVFG